ncbi:hypothetical protein [Actinoallomurus sp. NPDC050550]|uniref:hypothetical protein n=1 Tax=Actinoallomurus sp. NPDC050550 TaxID=3154937 RepID=UPI0033F78867
MVALRRFRGRHWLPLIGLLLLSALLAVHGPEDSPSTTASDQSIVLSLAVRSADAGPSTMRATAAADDHEQFLAGHSHSPVKTPQTAGQVCLALLAMTLLMFAAGPDAARERLPIIRAPASVGALRRKDRPRRPPGTLELSVLRL